MIREALGMVEWWQLILIAWIAAMFVGVLFNYGAHRQERWEREDAEAWEEFMRVRR